MESPLWLDPDWEQALARAADCRRVLLVGPPDVGKTSFILALSRRVANLLVLDLDPGQKMVGPPGCATLGKPGSPETIEPFVFLGSTAIGSFRAVAEAAETLLDQAASCPIAINTSGYVAGPGLRLQMITLAATRPDLVVAIGVQGPLAAALGKLDHVVSVGRSALARRKTAGVRRQVRQQAFDSALAGAVEQCLSRQEIALDPQEPSPFSDDARPVCSIADASGRDMAIAVLHEVEGERLRLLAPPLPRPGALLRLGRMWARERCGSLILLDRLAPAWPEVDG